MLGSRVLDSWNMTRRFFYIHASGLFVNTGFCMGYLAVFLFLLLWKLGGGTGCRGARVMIGGCSPGWLVSSQPLGFTEWWKRRRGRGGGGET